MCLLLIIMLYWTSQVCFLPSHQKRSSEESVCHRMCVLLVLCVYVLLLFDVFVCTSVCVCVCVACVLPVLCVFTTKWVHTCSGWTLPPWFYDNHVFNVLYMNKRCYFLQYQLQHFHHFVQMEVDYYVSFCLYVCLSGNGNYIMVSKLKFFPFYYFKKSTHATIALEHFPNTGMNHIDYRYRTVSNSDRFNAMCRSDTISSPWFFVESLWC